MTSKAYLNALAEEGTRQDLIDWLVKLDSENDALRAQVKALQKQVIDYAQENMSRAPDRD